MIEIFDNKNIQSFEYETSINSDGNIAGTCELGNATIQMLNDSNEYSSLKGQWIKTIHGSFYIHNVEPVQEKVNIKLSCYDVKYKLDTLYDSSLYKWPMTLKEWRNEIFTNCGVSYDNTDFPNSNLVLTEEPYIGDNSSNRTVISIIAQAGCSWVDTDKEDIFYFNWFDNTIHIVNDWIELTTEKEMSSPINVVVLGRGDVEDNVKWPETLPENPVEFRIDNNYILDPQESTEDKRYDVIETIYNRVNGFKYLVFNIRTQDIFNKLSIKLGQIVTYRDMWGNVLSANIMSKKITYLGGNLEDDDNYEITLSAEEIKETSTEYSYASSIENKLRKTQITVDKQNQRIDAIASDVNENTEKVASLEITTGNISTKVSSVETDLNTTNTNLSNLSNTVNTLSDDINGVSADFEEFKDNEYIQSIDNLQKQIDGAIQFWNGAEIPTINNYPANEWTTDKDKINHQADIYTVVQDVQGEMKQGKSYRFDKVNGVWKWIELTDNELSAVQALAQEALEKANKNATEIGTVKTRVSSLEQTDEQIKASVESIDKQIIPTANISGSNIYVEDASDNPLVKLEIEGKSKQETRSGKNNFDEEKAKKSSNYTANTSIGSNWYTITIDLLPNTEYTITRFANNVSSNAGFNLQFYLYETPTVPLFYVNNAQAETILNRKTSTFTTGKSGKIYLATLYGNDTRLTNLFNNIDIQIEKGNVSTEYEQYGVSPSPDHPSEIESVGNSYENLFNKDGVENGYRLGSDGTPFAESGYWLSDYIAVKKLENYVYSRKGVGGSQAYAFYDENKNFISRSFMTNTSTIYISTTENTKYIRITDLNESLEIAQLEEGSIAHFYIPYGKYGIEITNIGKNLFDYVTNIRGTVNGITSTINSDGSITVTGIPTVDYAGVVGTTNIDNVLENGQQYTISQSVITDSKVYIEVRAKNRTTNAYTYYSIASGSKSKTFTVDKSIYSYDIYIVTTTVSKWGTKSLTITCAYQLEKGDSATGFKKYQENISVIVLDKPLRSLPNGVKDIAYIKNNKLYVDRYVGSVILDGSESWNNFAIETTSLGRAILNDIGSLNTGDIGVMSDKLIGVKYNGSWNSEFDCVATYLNGLIMYLKDTSNITQFKERLSVIQPQVDYELATPVTEELGEIEMPSTLKGVNNICVNDDLEPTLNIEYVRDTTLSNYVEGQINKAMTIEERHYSELVIEDNSIKANVTEINSNISEMTEDIHTVQETLTSTEKTLEVISTNIDKTTGEIREVTTINGYKFNKDGLNIYTNENSFNTLIDNEGTYYKDGDAIISETTKDGFMATSIKNKGSEEYCYDESNKVYDFVKERIEVDGEYGYATFYNGVN